MDCLSCGWRGVVKWQLTDSDSYGSNIPQFEALVKHLKKEHYETYKTEVLSAMDNRMSNQGLGAEFDSMSWEEVESKFWDENKDLVQGVGASVGHSFSSSYQKVWDEKPQVISYVPEKAILVDSRVRKAIKVCTKCGKTEEVKTLVAYDGSHVHGSAC